MPNGTARPLALTRLALHRAHTAFYTLGKSLPKEPSELAQALSPQKVCSLRAENTGPAWKQLYKEARPGQGVGKAQSSQLHLPRGQAGLPYGHSPEPSLGAQALPV